MLKYHMEKLEIIETLKNNYNRDLRKQVVKTIVAEEKQTEKPNYEIISQIFTYVLKELNWKITDNLQEWDNTPFDVIQEVFPKIESTKWFEGQIFAAKKMIEMELGKEST